MDKNETKGIYAINDALQKHFRDDDRRFGELSFSLRELHTKIDDQSKIQAQILSQTEKTNGRTSKLERTMLVAITVIVVLLIVNGSRFVDFIFSIVK